LYNSQPQTSVAKSLNARATLRLQKKKLAAFSTVPLACFLTKLAAKKRTMAYAAALAKLTAFEQIIKNQRTIEATRMMPAEVISTFGYFDSLF
jgi:hypothetical protein